MTIAETPPPGTIGSDVEIRLHGRGGQGGVTCAKILAAVYADLGKSVQTFGDYSGERSGAPVRAYTRVSDRPISNRNKVYAPDHMLVLDPTLLGDDTILGLKPGGTLLINTPEPLAAFADRFLQFRLAVVDATAIARRHKIGTRSLVIVNTTVAGAFVRALDLPLSALEDAYRHLGLLSNLPAAREAFDAVTVRETRRSAEKALSAPPVAVRTVPEVLPLVMHVEGRAPALKTGNWRTQTPRYANHPAPCSAWCPAGNDVIGFVQALAREDAPAAARVLARTTPLAGVCGRVCPAPCMEGCNRREYDGAVNIRGLERHIADTAPVTRYLVTPCENPRRIAIVGGGPAGLGAAFTLAQAGHRVTIFDGEKKLGGVLHTGIPTYRLPRIVLDREIAAVLALGVETRLGVRLDPAHLESLSREFDGVILATGLQKLRALEGSGPQPEGVEQGIDFLHHVNTQGGVQMSGRVVVLGGGNTAMDCARSALRAGAEMVTVAYRRGRDEMPAIAEEVREAREEGIEFLYLHAPIGFTRSGGRVSGVELAQVTLGPPDESGRRRPLITDRRDWLACDAVLLALGQSPDLSLLPPGWTLEDGRILQGGAPLAVFAAGDVATGDGTVTHAIGDGRRAAGKLLSALGVKTELFARPDRALAVPVTDIRLDHFETLPPARERTARPAARIRGFTEVSAGLQDGAEAHRCFSCGDCTACDTCLVFCPEGIIRRKDAFYEIDYSYCKGCGICVTECPRKGMEMIAL
jgi:2-oxoacid:acceptor oxidoreductase gamma subunit (pyruvate/2-ketoisovalerate family)/2-oxoacid:acceptor oxidoreductase delta subunit (pyruvate/2-ketoisovalerate family)